MKKFTILAAFVLFATAAVFAQTEKTTIIINENGEKTTIVERWFRSRLSDPLPSLYYAYLDMRDGSFGPEASVPIRSSSFEWGMYSTSEIYSTRNSRFGVSSGIGISNSYNFFTHDRVLRVDEDHNAFIQPLVQYSSEPGNGPETRFAHKSFLRYWSLRIPLMLQLQWDVNGSPLALAAGAEVELRFGVRSFAHYGGSKHTITNSLEYNPLGVNALFSLSFDDAVIFFRMGLGEMFTLKNPGKDDMHIHQMAIGFGFNFD